MPTWNELDQFTAPRRLLVLLAGLAVVIAIRASFDATEPDLIGWASWFVQLAFVIALAGLCIARVVFVVHHRRKAGPDPEPVITERFVVIALIAAVLLIPVMRVRGSDDLDAVGLGVQLGAIGLLVAIGFRRMFLMIRGRSEFSMWPWVGVCLAISSALAATGQQDSTGYDVAFVLVLVLAVALLVMAVYRAVKHRRDSR